jgi:hypothetical protein
MSIFGKSMFSITEGQGFHMTFQNGWTVSVQWGRINYGSNRSASGPRPGQAFYDARTAEVSCWYGNDGAEEVQGYMLADDVADYIAAVASRV